MGKKLTTEQFVEKANKIHNSSYSYNCVDYQGADNFVDITCLIHGNFKQKPRNHLNGCGCSSCGQISFKNKKTITQETAFERLVEVHGDKYDYSLFEYTGIENKIKVICKIHGIFEPTYLNHYHGKTGCFSCQFKSKEEYLDIFKTVHGNEYDYSLVEFNTVSDKIKIICSKHGIFEQRLSAHKCGQTCPSCVSFSSLEENKWLDSLKIPTLIRQYKLFKNHIVDGYDPKTNTAYQYHGIYWHGHPDFFDQNEKHPHFKKKTFGEIYQRTLNREEAIRQAGYNLVVKWSHL